MSDPRLSIDYGTSNTVAVLRRPDGAARALLFDGSPLLPSAVFAELDGRLLVGRDAERGAQLDPTRFEPNPKRRIDDLEVLLGERTFSVVDLVAAVLRRIADEAARVVGGALGPVTLTCPAAWGQARRRVLVDAAAVAALGPVTVVPEPVAAASYFASVLGHRVPPGSCVVVYDLGAGTFDASVVRHTPDGLDTLACRGIDDFGGVDLDALVVGVIGRVLATTAPAAWQRLSGATTDPADRRHRRMLWEDARQARETLSREPSAGLHCVLAGQDVHLTREEFEAVAGPVLTRTVEVTVATLREARVPAEQVAGWFLVGGASRTPLVATLLHRMTGQAPVVLEEPQVVVAEGALYAASNAAWSGWTIDHPAGAPVSGVPAFPVSAPAGPYPGAFPGAFPVSGGIPVSGVPFPVSAPAGGQTSGSIPFPVSGPGPGVPPQAFQPPGPPVLAPAPQPGIPPGPPPPQPHGRPGFTPPQGGFPQLPAPHPGYGPAAPVPGGRSDGPVVRLAGVPIPEAVTVLASLSGSVAADLLGELEPPHAAAILAAMPVDAAADRLASMPADQAAVRLSAMPPPAAVAALTAMPVRAAADRLAITPVRTANPLLRAMPPPAASATLSAMPANTAALRLAGLPPIEAAQLLATMSPHAAAARLTMLLPMTAATILRNLPWHITGHLLTLMPPPAAAEVYGAF